MEARHTHHWENLSSQRHNRFWLSFDWWSTLREFSKPIKERGKAKPIAAQNYFVPDFGHPNEKCSTFNFLQQKDSKPPLPPPPPTKIIDESKQCLYVQKGQQNIRISTYYTRESGPSIILVTWFTMETSYPNSLKSDTGPEKNIL